MPLIPLALLLSCVRRAQGHAPVSPRADENTEQHEPFFDKIKYISRSKYHPAQVASAQTYAFIIAGDVYIPGYMVKAYELRLGDALRGTCRIANGARMPYRAVTVEQHVNADELEPDDESEGEDEALSDVNLPTGALRGEDDDSAPSDNSDDMAQLVAQHLHEYVERHGGEVRMAAPPSFAGSLAHYYRWAAEPAYTELIKGCARSHPTGGDGENRRTRTHSVHTVHPQRAHACVALTS